MIAYFGRICMLTEFVVKFKQYAFVVRSFSEPIMTLGFGLMLYGLITSDSVFRRWISARPILFIGKISYSMYLWHWIVAQTTSNWILKVTGSGTPGFYLAYVLSVLFLIPVSWLSYRLFEAPYFKKSHSSRLPAAPMVVAAEESI
jgi:peptidoglycan/LPS O-acetylase OafA/YrhL